MSGVLRGALGGSIPGMPASWPKSGRDLAECRSTDGKGHSHDAHAELRCVLEDMGSNNKGKRDES